MVSLQAAKTPRYFLSRKAVLKQGSLYLAEEQFIL
jgi:hypothetical protein